MELIVNRFIDRMNINGIFNIINIEENKNQKLLEKWLDLKENNKVLQLYHSIRDFDYLEKKDSIFNNGFYIGCADNKGYGVYLANHSRYSAFWAGSYTGVLVCDVIYDSKYIKRCKSEIYSPIHDSEYVVSKPELIFPRYYIKYSFETDENVPYVKRGYFNCVKCDTPNEFGYSVRCDCPFDNVDDNDFI